MDNEIKIVSCKTENDFKDYTDAFNNNDLPKTTELVRWFHVDNPLKENVVDFAVVDNEENGRTIAAIYAVFPVVFNIFGTIVKAVQSIDTLTDVNYRGKGLFIKLAKDVYLRAKTENYELVYGFPNGSSASGFFKKLDWIKIGEVPFIIKPLRSKYFSKIVTKKWDRFLPNLNLTIKYKNRLNRGYEIINIKKEHINKYDFTSVWKSYTEGKIIGIERNTDYIQWRIGQKPDENYIIDGLFYEGTLIGYIIYCVKEKHNGKIGYIMEYIYKSDQEKVAKALLKNALNNIKLTGADLVLCWCFDHAKNFKHFSKLFFFKMPTKLRPIELHFGASSFNNNEKIYDQNNWYISYFDSDTV